MKLFKKREHKDKESMVKGNSFGASGFTLGVLSILFSGVYGVVFSIVGFVLCFIQQRNKPTKLGKAGLILNGIGLVFSILWIFYLAPILADYINSALSTA